jgi:hypothetical protein
MVDTAKFPGLVPGMLPDVGMTLDEGGLSDDGPGASFWGDFKLSLDMHTRVMAAHTQQLSAINARNQRVLRGLHPFKVVLPQAVANGTPGYSPDITGPNNGYFWDVLKVVVTGFTSGTVTMFSQGGAFEEFVFTTPGQYTNASKAGLLWGADWLTFVLSGVTGNVNINFQGVEGEMSILAEYIL